jgi:hypothetical protein
MVDIAPPPRAGAVVTGDVLAEELADLAADFDADLSDVMPLGAASEVTGLPAFRAGFKSRAVGGGQLVMKPLGDGTDGLVNWIMDDVAGYLFHLVTGPNAGGTAACIGIGVDHGGTGLLISNKATGKGLKIINEDTTSAAAAYGLQVENESTTAPGALLGQIGAGAKPAATFSSDQAATAGQKQVTWQGAPGGVFTEYGYVNGFDGALVWNKKIFALSHIEIDGNLDHDGGGVGFYGTVPVARQAVAGSRGGNAALASLLTALAAVGLITNNSTA